MLVSTLSISAEHGAHELIIHISYTPSGPQIHQTPHWECPCSGGDTRHDTSHCAISLCAFSFHCHCNGAGVVHGSIFLDSRICSSPIDLVTGTNMKGKVPNHALISNKKMSIVSYCVPVVGTDNVHIYVSPKQVRLV